MSTPSVFVRGSVPTTIPLARRALPIQVPPRRAAWLCVSLAPIATDRAAATCVDLIGRAPAFPTCACTATGLRSANPSLPRACVPLEYVAPPFTAVGATQLDALLAHGWVSLHRAGGELEGSLRTCTSPDPRRFQVLCSWDVELPRTAPATDSSTGATQAAFNDGEEEGDSDGDPDGGDGKASFGGSPTPASFEGSIGTHPETDASLSVSEQATAVLRQCTLCATPLALRAFRRVVVRMPAGRPGIRPDHRSQRTHFAAPQASNAWLTHAAEAHAAVARNALARACASLGSDDAS